MKLQEENTKEKGSRKEELAAILKDATKGELAIAIFLSCISICAIPFILILLKGRRKRIKEKEDENDKERV